MCIVLNICLKFTSSARFFLWVDYLQVKNKDILGSTVQSFTIWIVFNSWSAGGIDKREACFGVDKIMKFRFFHPFLAFSHYTLRRTEMIKIRLQRHGARHAPFYRMVVAPSTSRRDGRFIEVLGTYNPQAHARSEELKLKMERVDHWLQVGAQPTDTAKSLIKQGRLSPEEWLERAEKKTKAKVERIKKKNAPVVEESAPVEEAKSEDKPAEVAAEEAKPEAKEAAVEETKEEKIAEPEPEPEAKAEEAKVETPKEDPVAEESKEDKESEA